MQNLFVYGTLLYPELWQRLVKRHYRHARAQLAGYRRPTVKGERYPALVPCRGGSVVGRLYFALHPDDMRRLDRYEGHHYRRQQVEVLLDDGRSVKATTYLFKKRYRTRLSSREWQPGLAHGRTLCKQL